MTELAPSLYLYLTEVSWVEPWERGGPIPINPASAYLSDQRQGTLTPDETIQRAVRGIPEWVVGGSAAQGGLRVQLGASVTLSNCTASTPTRTATIEWGRMYSRVEDGLILSFSTELGSGIAQRLGKKACVRIRSMTRLIESLNAQIGAECTQGLVRYRDAYDRNHFLKSAADAWQKEYRLLWLTGDVRPRVASLPPGIATKVYC